MDKLQEDFISSYTLHSKPIRDINPSQDTNKTDVIEGFNSNYKLLLANIPEHKRSYSSIWGNNRIGTGHARSMINSAQAWSSRYNNKTKHLFARAPEPSLRRRAQQRTE